MAILFSDGFETLPFTGLIHVPPWTGTGGAPTVVAQPCQGLYSAFFDADESCYRNHAAQSTLSSRIYFKIVQDYQAGYAGGFMWHVASGTPLCYGLLFGGGTGLYLRYRDGAALFYSGVYAVNLVDGLFHCIELKTIVADPGEYRLYLDDVEVVTVVGKDTNDFGNVDRTVLGKSWDYGTPKASWLIDCAVIADQRIFCKVPFGGGLNPAQMCKVILGL